MTVVACKPKPDKFDLGDLTKKIEGGDITIPQFQRQYVWNLEDCAKLPTALKTHLIDDVVKFGIRANDYRKFFDRRVERICAELTKCIVPRKEDELI